MMFRPMKDVFPLKGKAHMVAIQDDAGHVEIYIGSAFVGCLRMFVPREKEMIAALGFPTEPTSETVEQIDGVIE